MCKTMIFSCERWQHQKLELEQSGEWTNKEIVKKRDKKRDMD